MTTPARHSKSEAVCLTLHKAGRPMTIAEIADANSSISRDTISNIAATWGMHTAIYGTYALPADLKKFYDYCYEAPAKHIAEIVQPRTINNFSREWSGVLASVGHSVTRL